MTTALRAGTANDGYWQVNTTDVIKITSGRVDVTGNIYGTSGVAATSQYVILSKSAEGAGENGVVGRVGATNRWAIMLGSPTTSDFWVRRYDDTGAFLSDSIVINRSTGDITLTGKTTVNATSSALIINTTNGNQELWGAKNGFLRWGIQLGNGVTESGSNVGGNFAINRYADNGAYIATAMNILRDSGTVVWYGHMLPNQTNTFDLGSAAARWRNVYTNDLHLSNGIGDYTIVEGEEDLFLYNNKTGKTFKFALIPVDPSEVPAKAKV